jgi:hypothetical protein
LVVRKVRKDLCKRDGVGVRFRCAGALYEGHKCSEDRFPNSVRDVARGADGRRAFFQFLDWKISSPHAPPIGCNSLGMGREQPGELRHATIETAPKGAVIHGHQFQENIEIGDGVMGRRKKRAEHDRPAQD